MTLQLNAQSLPTAGFIRQSVFLPHLAFSATTLWRKVKQGSFPKPVKLSERVTAWRAEEVHAWINSRNVAA